jgi:hypothetical protein
VRWLYDKAAVGNAQGYPDVTMQFQAARYGRWNRQGDGTTHDGSVFLCGIAQVLLGCRFFPQLSESSVTEFLLHALAELVRLAKETSGSSLLGTFALVVHVSDAAFCAAY